MTHRENIRMNRGDLPIYQLMREAERRRQAEAERNRIPSPWPLAWVWLVLMGWCAVAAWG